MGNLYSTCLAYANTSCHPGRALRNAGENLQQHSKPTEMTWTTFQTTRHQSKLRKAVMQSTNHPCRDSSRTSGTGRRSKLAMTSSTHVVAAAAFLVLYCFLCVCFYFFIFLVLLSCSYRRAHNGTQNEARNSLQKSALSLECCILEIVDSWLAGALGFCLLP